MQKLQKLPIAALLQKLQPPLGGAACSCSCSSPTYCNNSPAQIRNPTADITARCRLEAGAIVLVPDPQSAAIYDIPMVEADTPEKIRRWVTHLAEKRWATPELLRRFIEVATAAAGLPSRL